MVAYTPTTNRHVSHFEVYIDGVFIEKVKKQFLLGINDITPGAHELRIVAVSDHLSATRASFIKRIYLKKNMPSINLSLARNKVKIGEKFSVRVYSPTAGEISIYHNTQYLGKAKNGTISVKAEAIGIGKTELYGMIKKEGKIIRTKKLAIEVTQ